MTDHSPNIDRAMILAAGLGTRMRPITNTLPKPLVPVAGRTLLDRALDSLETAGIDQVFVNVHYLADQIENHLANRPTPTTLISDERAELLDSGGGVKQAIAAEADGPLIILNGDSFWIDKHGSNIARLQAAWDSDRMDMLLLLADPDQAVGFDGPGDFFMNRDSQLARRGTAASAPHIYAGAIVTTVAYIRQITASRFSLNELFDRAIAKNRLYGLRLDGLWLHVGTPDSIGEAEQAIERYAANSGTKVTER